MRNCIVFCCLLLLVSKTNGQDSLRYFHPDSLAEMIGFLASDSLKGRGNYTPSLEKAAIYISSHFEKAGLQHLTGFSTYIQPFVPTFLFNQKVEQVKVNRVTQPEGSYFYISSYQFPPTLRTRDFKIIHLSSAPVDSFINTINKAMDTITNPLLFIVPEADAKLLSKLREKQFVVPAHTLLIIASNEEHPIIEVSLKPAIRKKMLFNVIGMLPGKNLRNEIVLITAHYDHIGVQKGGRDSIYNGANDNASGTAAMISMANYFAGIKNNERTILFVGFAGEELGMFGSMYLASMLNARALTAMFNLEMLGKINDAGRRSLIISGENKSTLVKIMRKYCKTIKIMADMYNDEKLFERSDNYPFALKGVPAHTFMCFTPSDKDYHQPSDEIGTLDMKNLSLLLKGLLPGISAVVSGKETPTRIK
jgi:hypothetical protein